MGSYLHINVFQSTTRFEWRNDIVCITFGFVLISQIVVFTRVILTDIRILLNWSKIFVRREISTTTAVHFCGNWLILIMPMFP